MTNGIHRSFFRDMAICLFEDLIHLTARLAMRPSHVGRVPRALTDVQRRGGRGTP